MRISKVNDKNYIVIQGWMLTDLHLKGNELVIYACIYGFSQLEGQVFSGSLQYLADWTNSTRQGVVKCLKSLIEKGYLEKADKVVNGVKFCEYRATKFNGVCNKVVQGMQQSCTGGVQQSSPNNLDIDNLEDKKIYTRFVKPTLEEVTAYCLERGKGVDPQKWYDYYSANGWKVGKNPMRDWKAAVRTWERSGDNARHKPSNFTPYPDEY
jgi:hypothetical protein